MSLKIFHICFISLSTLLCAGVSWWCFDNKLDAIYGYSFAGAAVILPIYGVWFLKKTRNLVL
jgi:hypothetical protein